MPVAFALDAVEFLIAVVEADHTALEDDDPSRSRTLQFGGQREPGHAAADDDDVGVKGHIRGRRAKFRDLHSRADPYSPLSGQPDVV